MAGRAVEPDPPAEPLGERRRDRQAETVTDAAVTAHERIAGALQLGSELGGWGLDRDPVLLVNLSGRGDKDVATAAAWFGLLDEGSTT